ncbi:M3 family metallopeptidase [Desulfuromonas sp. DDH964]|uniref:M3 family metallopeptidase n=1 Tax=Desulfuromonas sp. DDH964 TaxID=1823759 RepID=UPI0018D4BEE4|nr:M3 family metallopeptidase [Desulfuromonas sp. DDH964]
MQRRHLAGIVVLLLLTLGGCGENGSRQETASREPLQVVYQPGEITSAAAAAMDQAAAELDALSRLVVASRSGGALLRFEAILGALDGRMLVLTSMGDVATDAAVRQESFAARDTYESFLASVYTRNDLFQAISQTVPADENERQLLAYHRQRFTKGGLGLDAAQQGELVAALATIDSKESQFQQNIANDQTTLQFTSQELLGVPPADLARLPTTTSGDYLVTTEYQNFDLVVKYAHDPETRRRMMLAYSQIGGQANIDLLSAAIAARQQSARLLGYTNWGDYQTDGRMARTSAAAMALLNRIAGELAPRFATDMQAMLAAKQGADPGAGQLDSWDIPYYAQKVQAQQYSYDEAATKEYFSLDGVFAGLLDLCRELFGIRLAAVEGAVVWDPSVQLYALRDDRSDALLGYVYLDLYPRDGKYDWFATGVLRDGRLLDDGRLQKPVTLLIGNFIRGANGEPPLLTPFDVETLFHEFGHVLQLTLSKAPYTSLSGYHSPMDYIEIPSQLLQFFARDRELLRRISGHYLDQNRKIPDPLLDAALASASFNLGYNYTRQIWQSEVDMTLHTAATPLDPTATCNALHRELLGIDLPAGNLYLAGFGHLMGGYDAGYYGYLWGEVYAWDLLSEFQQTGFADPQVGRRYRQAILESGASRDPSELITDFLGRPATDAAFYRWVGIK